MQKCVKSMFILLLTTLCTLAPAVAQNVSVSGTVTDAGNEPLPGVNVQVKGTSIGTATDIDGKFTLQVPGSQSVLVFSYVGFLPQEIPVGNQRTLNVTLREDLQNLEEVIVIGYGTRAKKDLTGAISQINADDISKQFALSPEFAMQGTMAGVMVSNTGSSPVARPTIRIRGVSTIGYNDPLYVIDGVPLAEGGASSAPASRDDDIRSPINIFNLINQNDIESISVLKDASASAIYGVRASNGVVLITTKRGAEGRPKVSFSGSYGVQNIFKRFDVVSPQEYVDITLEAINNNPQYNKEWWYCLFDKGDPNYLGNDPDYSKDWLKKTSLVQNAALQDYNISVSGGTKMSTYATGVGFASQENVMRSEVFDRYSIFFNSDHKITNWLKVGESFRFAYTHYVTGSGGGFESVSLMTPWQPIYDSSRPEGYAYPGRTINGTFRGQGYGLATRSNTLASERFSHHERVLMRTLGTVYAEASPLKGLRLRGTYSFDYYTNNRENTSDPNSAVYGTGSGVPDLDRGVTYTTRQNENINSVKEFLVAYTNKFGDHSVDLLLNYMQQQVFWNHRQASMESASPMVSWEKRYIDEGWAQTSKNLYYERVFSGLVGYMGRLSYNYAQKYYLDVTVRRDGSSKFGPGYKWGVFPSFGGVWRVSSEKFMQDISWLNDLKIRGGWGQSGNQETREFAYLLTINMNPVGIGGTTTPGDGNRYPAAVLNDFPISDMSWETVTTFSLGFDMVALQNRLSLTAEYYSRITDGILQAISIPWTIGALRDPVVNMAKVSNKGFEFQAGYNDRFGEIGVHASANLTTVANKVSNMFENNRQITVGSENRQRIENGYSMNYWYGFKTDGIFQTQQEVDDYKAKINDVGYSTQKAPGDIKYVDLNGAPKEGSGQYEDTNPDGLINDYDRTYIGKSIPGYYYGITLGADYKKWDISLGFRGVGDVYRYSNFGLTTVNGGNQRFVTEYRNRWTPTNPSNTVPRAIQNDPSGNNRFSDRFIHNASFFRFQNVQVGYTFSNDLINKVGISNLRCYVSGQNIFVISPFPELDPENITTPTVFTVGVNINF